MNAALSRVGVIDLGSNSLKLLVVEGPDITLLRRATVEVRLFPAQGNLLEVQAINQAVEAVKALAIQAGEAGAQRLVVIATSALREAPNRRAFIQQLREVTALPLTLLSGEVEARLALDGMRTDPAIKGLQDFVGFDLGGGSLEIGRLQSGQCIQALSLPLGAVRLSRLIPAQPNGMHSPSVLSALREHVMTALASRVPLGCARTCPLVASGGALSNLLDLQHAAGEADNGKVMSVLTVRNWLARLSSLDLEARKAVPGMAQGRADILPTALATVAALAEHTGAESLQITHHGLRQGVAQLLLSDAADLLAAAPVLS